MAKEKHDKEVNLGGKTCKVAWGTTHRFTVVYLTARGNDGLWLPWSLCVCVEAGSAVFL